MSKNDTLISDAVQFYEALAANNTKTWWQDNKPTYDTKLKAPALQLLEDIAAPLAKLTDLPIHTKLFRPHRDVRFSKDKTPYNTHLHMMWRVESGAPQDPVFFFGVGRDYVTTGAGIMGFDKPVLSNWRQMVDLDTDRITAITTDLTGQGFTFREPALKRVPAPFDKDHPAASLLRMKGVVASRELESSGTLEEQIMSAFNALWPLNSLLISIADA
ncbi:TIGR02453 family protein [Yoonia sp. BS5-3]|uniref:TIGR02453 family protein n=1 Tax=Yoonia phaeophyticola TaxID=3137369 RepID=A0ABZ2VC03_9RHOB